MLSVIDALINLGYTRRGSFFCGHTTTLGEQENALGDSTRKGLVYNRSKPLDGIIAHLTREYGRNVHDEGIAEITASTYLNNNPSHHPKNAADPETDSHYWSEPVRSG